MSEVSCDHFFFVAGGIIDITVYKVLRGECLKKLHKAPGLGGQAVDIKFKEFLRETFCDIWDEYEQNHPNEVQKLMYEFTHLRQLDEDTQISFPLNLRLLRLEAIMRGAIEIGRNPKVLIS